MSYEKPDFVEIRMDAEIGSYQGAEDLPPAPVPSTEPAPLTK